MNTGRIFRFCPAFVCASIRIVVYEEDSAGYCGWYNTDAFGFDCLVMNAALLPGRRANTTYAQAEDCFSDALCHELNHCILGDCQRNGRNSWLGESLEAWMAQLLAAFIAGGSEGPYAIESSDAIEACREDLRVFLRDWQDFGQYLMVFDPPGAADGSIGNLFWQEHGFTAVSGGGTTFAYRNDEGGPISITGADDRWYFFAVTMELPDLEAVIEISGAEELARIGNDPSYPLSGSYILAEDIDLGGQENPWTPIGNEYMPFIGVFDGNGRTIKGL